MAGRQPNSFLQAARAAASPGEAPAAPPSAGDARTPVHVHASIQQDFRAQLRKLPRGSRTGKRFGTKVAELQPLIDQGQYRSYVLRAAALVVGELAKLGERDRGLADQLCVKAGHQMFGLALEVTFIRLGVLRAAGAGEGSGAEAADD